MAKIMILGSGTVGQATGKGFAKFSHVATFVDVNPSVLEKLRREGYEVTELSQIDRISCEISILCLPTPLKNGRVDLSPYENALPHLGRKLASCSDYHLIVVRSTVPPKTTERLIIPTLEKISGKQAGADFGVCMNPEFLREKSSEEDFLHPWSIVIGALDEKSGEALEELYKPLVQKENTPVVKTDLKTAEMIKYAQNLYNATKISFTNEIWEVSNKLGINGDLVMAAVAQSAEGIWNPKYGTKGGYPYVGGCLPKDTQGFLAYAKNELNIDMPLLEATIKVNQNVGGK